MEPERSMTAYALIGTAAVCLFALDGYQLASIVIVAVLAIWTLAWEMTYWRQRLAASPTSWRPKVTAVPAFRSRLDRFVRAQSFGCVLIVVVVVALDLRIHPQSTPKEYVEFLDGAVIASCFALWLSAIVDWYWILPRLGGVGARPRPCQKVDDPRWNQLTKVWLFHRGIATLVFIGGVAAIPGYLAVATHSHAFTVVMGILTFGVPAVMSEQASAAVKALTNGLNPVAPVGSILKVRLFDVATVYLVDTSLQGSKYRHLEGLPDAPLFRPQDEDAWKEKSDGPQIPNAILASPNLSEVEKDAASPCLGGCRGANWYCLNNKNAYSRAG